MNEASLVGLKAVWKRYKVGLPVGIIIRMAKAKEATTASTNKVRLKRSRKNIRPPAGSKT